MKRLNDYARSLPVRLVAAAIVLAIMFALGKFDDKEEPASSPPGQQSGIMEAYRDSTDTALRVMASRPPDK